MDSLDSLIDHLVDIQAQWTDGVFAYADNHPTTVVVVGIAFLGAVWVGLAFADRGQEKDDPKAKPGPKTGSPGYFERRKYEQPVSVANVHFDRAWRHGGIIGTTGSRKSTLLAMLAEEIGKPCIVISGDQAPPLENLIRSRSGYVWKPRGGVSWYPWAGELERAVQRVEHGYAAVVGDAGVHRSAVRQAARQAWGLADGLKVPRELSQVRFALKTNVSTASNKALIENWSYRLIELEQALGSSLGPGLDVVEALRERRDVGIFLNSFEDVSNRKLFAAVAILEALRAADILGDITVIIDEVGLVGAGLFGDAVRTFRVRKVTGLFASQIADDFPPELRGNINVWFLGQQSGGDKSSREWSSNCTFRTVAPEAFGEHALPHGKFYVVAGGRVQQAAVPTWKMRKVPDVPVNGSGPGGIISARKIDPDPQSRNVYERVYTNGTHNGVHALGPGKKSIPPWIEASSRRREMWNSLSGTWDEHGDHIWTQKSKHREKYGKAAYANASGWQSHFLFWSWAVIWHHEHKLEWDLERFYGEFPEVTRFEWPAVRDELVILRALKQWMLTWMEPIYGEHIKKLELSIDHECNNTLCQNYKHLHLLTGTRNSELRWERKR